MGDFSILRKEFTYEVIEALNNKKEVNDGYITLRNHVLICNVEFCDYCKTVSRKDNLAVHNFTSE